MSLCDYWLYMHNTGYYDTPIMEMKKRCTRRVEGEYRSVGKLSRCPELLQESNYTPIRKADVQALVDFVRVEFGLGPIEIRYGNKRGKAFVRSLRIHLPHREATVEELKESPYRKLREGVVLHEIAHLVPGGFNHKAPFVAILDRMVRFVHESKANGSFENFLKNRGHVTANVVKLNAWFQQPLPPAMKPEREMKVDGIRQMTKATVEEPGAEIKAALHAIAEKHNLELESHGGRYSTESYTPRITFKTKLTADGRDAAEAAFARDCRAYGLEPGDYKAIFQHHGETFEVVGFESSRPKYAIKTRRMSDGKTVLFASFGVRRMIDEYRNRKVRPALPPLPLQD